MGEGRRNIDVGLGLVAALVMSVTAQADNGPRNLENLSLEELLNIRTVSASKLDVPAREAPAIMNVVNGDQIESYGYISLNEVLYQQPGFSPSQDYDRR